MKAVPSGRDQQSTERVAPARVVRADRRRVRRDDARGGRGVVHGRVGATLVVREVRGHDDRSLRTTPERVDHVGHDRRGSAPDHERYEREVLEDALRIELSLPWLLAKAANRLVPILRKEATRLLEKK